LTFIFTEPKHCYGKKGTGIVVEEQKILNRIYVVRRQKIMLDRDLAEMYGVETKVFNPSVKRNINRFPKDFCLL
jgi:hypothetical protein